AMPPGFRCWTTGTAPPMPSSGSAGTRCGRSSAPFPKGSGEAPVDSSRRGFLGLGAAAAAGWLVVGCAREGPAREPSPSRPAPPALPPPIPAQAYGRRRSALAARMRKEGFDFLLCTPGASFSYLTGADLWRSERLIALVLDKNGDSRCLAPAFERDRMVQGGF